MKLLWKLLRKHVSLGQLLGFSLAYLIGVGTLLLAFQIYSDVSPIVLGEDHLLGDDYLVVSKKVSTTKTFLGASGASHFSEAEIEDLRRQPFTTSLAPFQSSQYRVGCYISLHDGASVGTDMFFESVPGEYVDIAPEQWSWQEGNAVVPIVIPRTYLALYNFGFAQSHSLPQLNEKLITKIGFTIVIRGEGGTERLNGRVVGFSNRLNTILVPQTFLEWSNRTFAPSSDKVPPSRLILATSNPADATIATYMTEHGYELDSDRLSTSKTAYLLRLATLTVVGIGLLISLLSVYILLLSINLLIEKNATKLENLQLMGYSRRRVALPYQLLSVILSASIMIVAMTIVTFVRGAYLPLLSEVFPETPQTSVVPMCLFALTLLVICSTIDSIIIYNKIQRR